MRGSPSEVLRGGLPIKAAMRVARKERLQNSPPIFKIEFTGKDDIVNNASTITISPLIIPVVRYRYRKTPKRPSIQASLFVCFFPSGYFQRSTHGSPKNDMKFFTGPKTDTLRYPILIHHSTIPTHQRTPSGVPKGPVRLS